MELDSTCGIGTVAHSRWNGVNLSGKSSKGKKSKSKRTKGTDEGDDAEDEEEVGASTTEVDGFATGATMEASGGAAAEATEGPEDNSVLGESTVEDEDEEIVEVPDAVQDVPAVPLELDLRPQTFTASLSDTAPLSAVATLSLPTSSGRSRGGLTAAERRVAQEYGLSGGDDDNDDEEGSGAAAEGVAY